MTDRLVLSVSEAANALGVSDDLVYELTERGDLPCLRIGRRKLIPRQAIEQLVESAVVDFDPSALLTTLHGVTAAGVCDTTGVGGSSMLSRTAGPEIALDR